MPAGVGTDPRWAADGADRSALLRLAAVALASSRHAAVGSIWHLAWIDNEGARYSGPAARVPEKSVGVWLLAG